MSSECQVVWINPDQAGHFVRPDLGPIYRCTCYQQTTQGDKELLTII